MNCKVSVKSDTKNLQTIRSFVENTLLEMNIGENECYLLTVAVDEICANRIIHSHVKPTNDKIEVVISRSKEEVVFEIVDQGKVFNMVNYQQPSIEKLIKEKKTGGIGLILVRKIVDEIQFETRGEHQVCRLCKNISA